VRLGKEAIRTVAPAFTAQRMFIEYIRRLYLPASRGGDDEPGSGPA
jgi:hypothetical protein